MPGRGMVAVRCLAGRGVLDPKRQPVMNVPVQPRPGGNALLVRAHFNESGRRCRAGFEMRTHVRFAYRTERLEQCAQLLLIDAETEVRNMEFIRHGNPPTDEAGSHFTGPNVD